MPFSWTKGSALNFLKNYCFHILVVISSYNNWNMKVFYLNDDNLNISSFRLSSSVGRYIFWRIMGIHAWQSEGENFSRYSFNSSSLIENYTAFSLTLYIGVIASSLTVIISETRNISWIRFANLEFIFTKFIVYE